MITLSKSFVDFLSLFSKRVQSLKVKIGPFSVGIQALTEIEERTPRPRRNFVTFDVFVGILP